MPAADALHAVADRVARYFTGALRHQLVLAVVVVHAVLIIVFAADLGLRQVNAMERARNDRAQSLAQMLASSSSPWVLSADVSGLKEIVDAVGANRDLRYAMILTPSGKVLAHTDANRTGLEVSDAQGRSLQSGPPRYRVLASTDDSLDVAAPILADHQLIGWAWVSFSRADVRSAVAVLIFEGAFYAILAILIGGLVAASMARNITRGLDGLVEVVTRFKDGDRTVRVNSRRQDEIGVVGAGLDSMLESVESSERQLRAARDHAQAADRAKSEFLANVSHEIRTPMNGVLGALHLLKGEPVRSERDRLVELALSSGVGLSDLLNDVIDYSDMGAGRLELSPEPTEPAVELENVLALMRPKAATKGLEFGAETMEAIGWVRADPARLRKMFFHLIGNAVKFTPMGRIEVRLSARGEGEGRRLRFEVTDTGIGVPPETRQRLFEHFSQADGSSTRRYGGQGLGLAITRRIAELMDGEVGCDSVPGQGSTFWIDVATPACAADEGMAPGQGWLRGLRVLVVEDNPTNRLVATKMLGQLGAEVETADDGAQGVAAVERSDFDLVFMDIQMPVMDGVEATRRIRAMSAPKSQTPIVATTANVLPEQLAAYRRSGMNGVVAKPISPNALLTEVARVASGDGDISQLELTA